MALSDDILKLKDVFNGANPLQAGMDQAGGTLQLPNVQDIRAPQVAAPQPLMTPELAAQREAERGPMEDASFFGNIRPAFSAAPSNVAPREGIRTTETGGIQSLPTNVVQPPTGDIGMAAESPIEPQSTTPPRGVIPPEGLNAPVEASPQIGGTITRGGETTFFQQGGGQIATPSASQLSSFAEQQRGAEYNVVPELGADKPGFGPTTRTNIAAGRPPNVSAEEVASAQKQMAEQETARTIDRAVAEYEQSLPNGGLGASAADRAEREEKVAQYRAGLIAKQESERDTRSPERIEQEQLANERTRQIIEAGKKPNATPAEKKASERAQAVKDGTITQAQADEATKRDLLGNPPASYDTWAEYESATGTDADGDGKVATEAEAEEVAEPASTSGAPVVGTIKGGYRFKGGDPSKKENWEKV